VYVLAVYFILLIITFSIEKVVTFVFVRLQYWKSNKPQK